MNLVLLLFLAFINVTDMYSIKLVSGETVTFYHLNKEEIRELLDSGEWVDISEGKKFKHTYRSTGNKYLGVYKGGDGIMLQSEREFRSILSNSIVLFRNEKDDKLYPFLLLDKSDIISLKNDYELELLTPSIQNDVYSLSTFYRLKDGRILSIEENEHSGELFLDTEGVAVYHEFVSGGHIGVVFTNDSLKNK